MRHTENGRAILIVIFETETAFRWIKF